jgi:hypothetical protein
MPISRDDLKGEGRDDNWTMKKGGDQPVEAYWQTMQGAAAAMRRAAGWKR